MEGVEAGGDEVVGRVGDNEGEEGERGRVRDNGGKDTSLIDHRMFAGAISQNALEK
jgi:hypothetical protein